MHQEHLSTVQPSSVLLFGSGSTTLLFSKSTAVEKPLDEHLSYCWLWHNHNIELGNHSEGMKPQTNLRVMSLLYKVQILGERVSFWSESRDQPRSPRKVMGREVRIGWKGVHSSEPYPKPPLCL